MVKLEMIPGPFQAILFTFITWKPRIKLYVPREAPFLIPLKYIDVTRATSTSLDVMLEKNIDDYWNVDGDRENVRYVDKFYKVHFIGWKTTWIIYMDRSETDKKANDLQTRFCVARDLERYVEKKQNWAIEKPKLDNARKLRGIYFINPADEEFKDILKKRAW